MRYPVGLSQRILGNASLCSQIFISPDGAGLNLRHCSVPPHPTADPGTAEHQFLQLNLPPHSSFWWSCCLQKWGFIFLIETFIEILHIGSCVSFYSSSPKGNILQTYNTLSQPGYWQWHDPLILSDVLILLALVCVCVREHSRACTPAYSSGQLQSRSRWYSWHTAKRSIVA